MEDRLDIINQIKSNVSYLEEELSEENVTVDDIKWIISDIHELLDDLLIIEEK